MTKRIFTTEDFIAKAKEIHGDKFDYAETKYVNYGMKVTIICPNHGKFEITPYGHLKSKDGCPECSKERCANNKRMAQEEFIRLAKEKHGDKYDYSKTVYVNSSSKIIVTCPIHSDFETTPNKHLMGRGCRKCQYDGLKNKHKQPKEEFIRLAKEKHGDKYDYRLVPSEVLSKDYIEIICPIHGKFKQTVGRHLSGRGCPSCGGSTKLTQEEFIKRANEVHNNFYNYSKTIYKNMGTKIIVTCPIHGDFEVDPHSHLTGCKCHKCVSPNANMTKGEYIGKATEIYGDVYDFSLLPDKIVMSKKIDIICPIHGIFQKNAGDFLRQKNGCPKCNGFGLTTEDFIKKSKEMYGDKFNYDKTVYVNAKTPVVITCPIHGDFEVIPSQHFIYKKGCPRCVRENMHLTKEEFIKKAQSLHCDKYDYSMVEDFSSVSDKVTIICKEHGPFRQQVNCHLKGMGCPNCQGLRGEYKFNLLEEFTDEFHLRDFLMTNDENMIYIILRNIEKIEPKFNPIVKDIDRALHGDSNDPIKDLEDKYRKPEEESTATTTPTTTEEPTTTSIDEVDLDDDDAVEVFINNVPENEKKDKKKEPTIEDLTKARESEIKIINEIEHMLTPEDRQFIKDKFLNDRRRDWMLERDSKKIS